jgi:HK97 gp10 family phage protein
MTWHGDEFLAAVRARLASNLGDAGEMLADEMAASVGQPYPPASSPGDEPHRRTGNLQASITSELDAEALRVTVGSPVEYALYLELGTHRMAARPFVYRALANNADAIVSIVADGIGNPTD